MRNKRKLAIISLVVMMVVTAVGYAAYSDTLQATGSASTAAFDVQFYNAPQSSPNVKVTYGKQIVVDGENLWDKADFVVSDLLPGKVYTVAFGFQNNGSVPAVLTAGGSSLVPTSSTHFAVSDVPSVADLTAPIPAGEYRLFSFKIQIKPGYSTYTEGTSSLSESWTATLNFTQVP